MEITQWFGQGEHDIKIMKSLSKSNYHMYANLPGAIELRESSYRWIGKQLGAALLGEGVAGANEQKRFLLVCCPLGKQLQLAICCGLSLCLEGSGQVIPMLDKASASSMRAGSSEHTGGANLQMPSHS